MTATVALPDSAASTSTARSLWKELILEGKYDAAMSGFDVSLVFTRGTNDTITITAPSSSAADGLETQGAFLRGAPHVIGTDNPLQADLDIMFRNMSIVVVDSEGVYP